MSGLRSSFLVTVNLLLFTTLSYGGGGWPQKKKGLYTKLSYWQVVYSKFYDPNGNLIKDRKRGIYNINLYAEYGFTDKLTTALYFPFYTKVVVAELYDKNTGNVLAEGDKVSSLGDAEFSLKYGVFKNDFLSLSPSILIGLPFGVTNGGRDGSLWTGDGEVNTMLRVDLGGSVKIKNMYPYFNVYFGFNNRTKNFSNELRYGIELGSELGRLLLIGRMDVVKSLNNGDSNLNQQISGLQLNNSEYINLSLEIGFNITKNSGVSVNVTNAIKGKLIFSAPSASFGVFVKI